MSKAEETAQGIKHLLYDSGDRSLTPQNACKIWMWQHTPLTPDLGRLRQENPAAQ